MSFKKNEITNMQFLCLFKQNTLEWLLMPVNNSSNCFSKLFVCELKITSIFIKYNQNNI